jgi:hypothetical protein
LWIFSLTALKKLVTLFWERLRSELSVVLNIQRKSETSLSKYFTFQQRWIVKHMMPSIC